MSVPFLLHATRLALITDIAQYLVSIAALTRPRTIINLMGVRPSVLLYKLTAGVFIFNLYMSVATDSE